tara:strand:- start:6059 stop:6931 length:873 start_codon:yes stop_codon:yes gene_type:complete
MKLSIIIPTKDRPKKLLKLIAKLRQYKFFFNEIIIVDSSNRKNKRYIKNKLTLNDPNIKLINSKPSISYQRNLGIKKIRKSNNYIMFLDDDILFKNDSFKNMKKFIEKNDYIGYSFNYFGENKSNFYDKLKKSKLSKKLGVYDSRIGAVSSSGWHSKIVNVKKDTEVDWLPTSAVIYKSNLKLNFDNFFSGYSYLEDLDFSFRARKKGKLVIVKKAIYFHKNFIERESFEFGKKELINRYYFVKKNKLKYLSFFISAIIFLSLNLLKLRLQRFFGNLLALMQIIFSHFFL